MIIIDVPGVRMVINWEDKCAYLLVTLGQAGPVLARGGRRPLVQEGAVATPSRPTVRAKIMSPHSINTTNRIIRGGKFSR